MKRSVIFGLFCMAASMYYYFNMYFVLLLISISQHFYDMPHVAAHFTYEEPFYRLIRHGQGMNIVFALAIIFPVVMIWLLVRSGFITRKRLKFWRSIPEYARSLPGGWLSFAVRAVMVAAAVYGCYTLAENGYFLLDSFRMSTYLETYGANLALIIWTAQLSVPSLFLAFTIGVFAHTVMTFNGETELRRGLKVVMAGVAVFALVLTASLLSSWYIDGHMSLSDIDGISVGAESRIIIALSGNPHEISVDDDFNDYNSDPLGLDVPVAYSKSNERAIKEYLNNTGGRTVLRNAACNYLIAKNVREFDFDSALPYYVNEIKRTADIKSWSILLNRINLGAVNAVNTRLLDAISDESVLWIGGKSALRLSKAYARFSDMEKARYWYDSGAKTTEKLSKEEIAWYKPKEEQPFVKGVISGRINLADKADVSCGVGLMRMSHTDSLTKDYKKLGGFKLRYVLPSHLIAAKILRSSGDYSFDGLPADEYMLLISLPNIEGKKYRVVNSPGPIIVSEDNPSVDVGTIELVLEDEGNG